MSLNQNVHGDGKHSAAEGERFASCEVTYGAFPPRDDGSRDHDRDTVERGSAGTHKVGSSLVRTSLRPDDVVDPADWRSLTAAARSQGRQGSVR